MVVLLKIAPAFSISHDGLNAQGIMVFIRYMLLTLNWTMKMSGGWASSSIS